MFSLYSCFAPRLVYNRHTGREVVTFCGRCPYCLAVRSFDLTARIKREFLRQGECLALFITLTYDNDNLPVYRFDGRSKRWHSNVADKYPRFSPIKGKDVVWYAPPEGYIDTSLVCGACNSRSVFRRKDRPLFAHLCYPDVQAYLNRCRAMLFNICKRYDDHELHKAYESSELDYEQFKFRYAVCGEYGPTTLRPHYHLIVWFNHRANDRQIAALSQILSACWSFGIVDCQTTTTDGVGSYLASYLSSVAGVPEILRTKQIRPFIHYSQAPVTGVMFNLRLVCDVGSSRTDIQAHTPPLANLGRSVKKRMSLESIDLGLRLLG